MMMMSGWCERDGGCGELGVKARAKVCASIAVDGWCKGGDGDKLFVANARRRVLSDRP